MAELVRDKVPNLMKLQGLNPTYLALPKKDSMRKLHVRNKFVGVSGEVDLAMRLAKPEDILNSLAKMMDMVSLAAKEHGITMVQVRETRDHLRALKGKYNDFIILQDSNSAVQSTYSY